jgi:glycosyltransferase involved in cell wall biosynthesis
VRIWIVNHYADPPDGLATRTFDLSRALAGRGHEVTIFVSSFSHYRFEPMRDLGGALWRTEMIDGVRFVWLRGPGYRGNDWRRVLNMVSFAVAAVVRGAFDRGRPEVVIGVSVHPVAALAGWVLARLKGARFFLEVTDLWPQTLIDFQLLRPDSLAARAMRGLERFLFKRAERIIMLWRDTGDYVESVGVSRAKIVWIPHGVDLEKYRSLRPYDGGRHAPPFVVMFLGGFVAANALDVILAAARILQERGRTDIELRLVGAGTERQSIVGEAAELGLTNVVFPAAVPKTMVPEVMGAADAFIYGIQDLPIYRYGISLNKLTDYLAGSRPIVFYGNSSYDPVSIARAGIQVPPANPSALADAIVRLAELAPEERLAMGRRGRAYLVENHAIPRLADRLEAALRS